MAVYTASISFLIVHNSFLYLYYTEKHYLLTIRYVKTHTANSENKNMEQNDTWNHQPTIFNINNHNGTQGTVHTV